MTIKIELHERMAGIILGFLQGDYRRYLKRQSENPTSPLYKPLLKDLKDAIREFQKKLNLIIKE